MTESLTRFDLPQSAIPTRWYNIQADLPRPLPPVLHPGTKQPIGPADLAPLFPMELIMQEVTTEREVEIPEPVRDVFRLWRPTPMFRAHRLEQALGTPARIFYKYEGVSPAGSHKPNTAIAQAFYTKQAGIRRLTTETGAGQWGSSLAFAGALFGIDVVTVPSPEDALERLQVDGYRIATTVVDGGEPYDTADLSGPIAVVLGSEAHGADGASVAAADLLVTIPMAGPTESLNVAMAGTIVCFEVLRRVRGGADPAS